MPHEYIPICATIIGVQGESLAASRKLLVPPKMYAPLNRTKHPTRIKNAYKLAFSPALLVLSSPKAPVLGPVNKPQAAVTMSNCQIMKIILFGLNLRPKIIWIIILAKYTNPRTRNKYRHFLLNLFISHHLFLRNKHRTISTFQSSQGLY